MHQILLIAGDFEIIEAVRLALARTRIHIQTAYNHREGLFALEHGAFDALLVDAAMLDRYEGVSTLRTLRESDRGEPLIAIAVNGASDTSMADAVIRHLEATDILAAVGQVLNLASTIPDSDPADHSLNRQLQEMHTFLSLSRSLTEVLDLDEVLTRIVEGAQRLTNADEGMILLPEGEDLYLRAKVGVEATQARNFRLRTRDTLAGQVFESGQPVLIGESGPQKLKTQYFVNSLLYVPLLLHGEVIGVLGVNNKHKEDVFTAHHQQLLVNLASFATIAIVNARIHQDSLDRARELETLVSVSEVLNSSLSLAEALPNVCEQLAAVLNVGTTEILFLEQDRDVLVTMARHFSASWRFGSGPTIDLSADDRLLTAVQGGEYRWFQQDKDGFPAGMDSADQTGADALLVLPVYAGDNLAAMLRVHYASFPRVLPDQEMIFDVYRRIVDAVAHLEPGSGVPLTDDLLDVVETVNNLLGADWCDLSLPLGDKTALQVVVCMGSGVWMSPPQPCLELDHLPDLREALDRQTMIDCRADNGQTQPLCLALLDRMHSRAVLGIPLVQRGKVNGLVVFGDTRHARVFNQREINMARAIVGQAATALESASLVHELASSLQELKTAQSRLIHTARLSAMGELSAVVAHQINNPLTTIIADAELMLLDEDESSPRYKSLKTIVNSGKRAANVARRLLAISRPIDPEASPDLVDVVETLREMLSLLQTHFERRKNITVTVSFPDEPLPPVMAVRGQLDDIWLNLLMNAYDVLIDQADGQIEVGVYYDRVGRTIDVSIRDNGAGISDDIRDQIFSPFFTTKPPGEGTGLGLHISQEMVRNVGGHIRVESVPGEGTCFTVHLPVL